VSSRIAGSQHDAPLERIFAFAEQRTPAVLSAAILGAVLLHAAAAFALPAKQQRVAPPPPALEAEFTQAPEVALPPPEPKPDPAPPAPTAAPTPELAAPKPNGAPPPAARAGNVLTAKDEAANDAKDAKEEPVEFVTDPDGASYGSGVVARGGTADVGLAGASANGASGGTGGAAAKAEGGGSAAAPGSTPAAETITPAANLSQLPKLTEADACKGFFPSEAADDAAIVTLVVVVKTSGAVSSASIVAESPKGEGFGNAARACLLSKRFTPGLDKSGAATLSSATLNVHFTR
jgi:protein TonB